MVNLKDLSFKVKIQASFFLLAAISTIMVVNDLYHFIQLSRISDTLNHKIIVSREHMTDIQTEFQDMQFYLLKFSIPGFEDQFENNFKQVDESKKQISKTMLLVKDSLLADIFEEHSQNFDKILNEYFGNVVDGTLSAAAMKDFEMASYIATTSGEELRLRFIKELEEVRQHIEKRKEELEAEVNTIMSRTIAMIIIGMIIGTLTFLITFFKIIPTLIKPVRKFKELLYNYSLGDFEKQMKVKSNDEFGQMAVMLNKLRDSQLEKIEAAEKIAEGNLEHKINSLSEHDFLSKSFEKMVDNLNKLVLEINFLTTASIKGNSGARGNTKVFNGGYRNIIQGINDTLDAVYSPINEAISALEKVAAGDFTIKIIKDYSGDHERIKNSINNVTESLGKTLTEVSQGASEVASAVEQMTRTIFETTKNTTTAAEASKNAGRVAKDGGKVVKETIEGMIRISEVVKKSAETVQELGKSSNEIGEIIQVIDDIADQTNLLALNAAIEAARAGEQGRGFAVVADEVRKLAERTSKATQEIAGMIKHIQKDTEGAVKSMQQGTKEVENGRNLAQKAGDSLKEIIMGADSVTDIVTQVAAASEEQSRSSEQITQNIELITNVTQQSATGVRQIAHAAEELNQLTSNLQSLISAFKVNDSVYYKRNEILSEETEYVENNETRF